MDLIKKAFIDYVTVLKYLRSKKLWVLLLIPGLISFILGVIFFYYAYLSGAYIADFFSGLYPFEFGKRAANTFFHLVPFTYIIAVMILKYVIYIAISPFMDLLSQRIEKQHNSNIEADPLLDENRFIRTLKVAGRSVYKELMWTILFMALGILVPVAGLAGFLITQSYYIGVLHLDYFLARKRRFRSMIHWIGKNKGLPLGNGFIYITLIFIPLVGIIIAPVMATAAGTISALDQLNKADVPL